MYIFGIRNREGGSDKGFRVSVLYMNALQWRWGAHLSQPTLRGRFLISSHCQPEHLRRLLPPVTWNAWDAEMKGWGAGKRERERVESEKGSDEQEEVWEVIWQALRHCDTVYSSLIFHGKRTEHLMEHPPVWSRGSFHWWISNPARLAIPHEVHKPDWEVNPTPGATKMKRRDPCQSSGVCVHAATHALAPHKASGHLMKPLSFRNGMEVDALH